MKIIPLPALEMYRLSLYSSYYETDYIIDCDLSEEVQGCIVEAVNTRKTITIQIEFPLFCDLVAESNMVRHFERNNRVEFDRCDLVCILQPEDNKNGYKTIIHYNKGGLKLLYCGEARKILKMEIELNTNNQQITYENPCD